MLSEVGEGVLRDTGHAIDYENGLQVLTAGKCAQSNERACSDTSYHPLSGQFRGYYSKTLLSDSDTAASIHESFDGRQSNSDEHRSGKR